LRIGLDATYSVGSALSGVGVYSRNIIAGLASQHPESRFNLCYRPHRFFRSFRETMPANCSRSLLFDGALEPSCDLFHGLNQRLPAKRPRLCVTTFHDLFVLTAEYSTQEFRARFAAQARNAATGSDLIIAVSQFTASQVSDLLGIDARTIRVVHHGVSGPPAAFQRRPENLILHVGAIQERKNISRLIAAFETLPGVWKLVLAGSAGYGAEKILEQVRKSPAAGRIEVTGYVSQDELEQLYARASIFAFPSLDEGFGLPVLDAMARGVPVVTSNSSALREVAGDAALLVDPKDTEAIRHSLVLLMNDDSARGDLVARGYGRAKEFTWEKAATNTWSVYTELLR
jgi:glycosyltransferase involved in cell wall biosynthesis